MANTLKLYRNGAVGFIDWLDRTLATFARGLPHAGNHNRNDNTHYDADNYTPRPHEHNVVVGRQTEFTIVRQQEVESSSSKTRNSCTDGQPFCPRRERGRASEQHESGKRGWE